MYHTNDVSAIDQDQIFKTCITAHRISDGELIYFEDMAGLNPHRVNCRYIKLLNEHMEGYSIDLGTLVGASVLAGNQKIQGNPIIHKEAAVALANEVARRIEKAADNIGTFSWNDPPAQEFHEQSCVLPYSIVMTKQSKRRDEPDSVDLDQSTPYVLGVLYQLHT